MPGNIPEPMDNKGPQTREASGPHGGKEAGEPHRLPHGERGCEEEPTSTAARCTCRRVPAGRRDIVLGNADLGPRSTGVALLTGPDLLPARGTTRALLRRPRDIHQNVHTLGPHGKLQQVSEDLNLKFRARFLTSAELSQKSMIILKLLENPPPTGINPLVNKQDQRTNHNRTRVRVEMNAAEESRSERAGCGCEGRLYC